MYSVFCHVPVFLLSMFASLVTLIVCKLTLLFILFFLLLFVTTVMTVNKDYQYCRTKGHVAGSNPSHHAVE